MLKQVIDLASNPATRWLAFFSVLLLSFNLAFVYLVYDISTKQATFEDPFYLGGLVGAVWLGLNCSFVFASARTLQARLRGWWTFLCIFLIFNAASIGLFYLVELFSFPFLPLLLSIGILLFNFVLLRLHLFEGRRALKRIPAIAFSLAVATTILGLLMTNGHHEYGLLESIYRMAQLFAGESQWVDSTIENLRTEAGKGEFVALQTNKLVFDVARLAALIATISAVLALVRQLVDRIKVLGTKSGQQIVLCGLGEAGLELARKWHRNYGGHIDFSGQRLLIIEQNPANPNVETARDMGFGVLIGDVLDTQIMLRARLDKASAVIMLLSDDKRNVELALELRSWIASRRNDSAGSNDAEADKKKAVRLLIHIDDTGLARRLQDHSRAGAETYTDTRFFDFYETSARSLFQKFPMESSADLLDTGVVHLAIYGFSKMGEAVLREAVRLGVFPDRKPLRISIFDQRTDQEEFQAGFWRANPGLKKLVSGDDVYRPIDVRIDFYPLDDARRGIDHRLIRAAADNAHRVPATQHIVCFDNDALSASFAIGLRDALRELHPENVTERLLSWDAPIFARLKRRHGLARLFLEGVSEPGANKDLNDTPDTLYAFGMLDDLVDPEQLLDDRRDELAKVLHEVGYRPQRGEGNPVKNIWRRQTNVPWRFLPLHYKGSNRAQADHIHVKLRSLACGVHVPSRRRGAGSGMIERHSNTTLIKHWESFLSAPTNVGEQARLTSDTWLECLARVEHDRWAVYHLLENWRHATQRTDAARTHDNLTGWTNLGGRARAYDAEHIKKLPEFVDELERASRHNRLTRTICREVRIGIVGHLPDRLAKSFPWLALNRDVTGTLPSGEGLVQEAKAAILAAAAKILEQASDASGDVPVKVILVTTAAEGADRVIAEALLEDEWLAPELEVILPLPWELYYMTFQDEYESRKASVDQFTKLAKRARATMQLPMRFGSLAALGGGIGKTVESTESVNPYHEQLQLANAYLVQHCDFLIAAWDGSEVGADPANMSRSELINLLDVLHQDDVIEGRHETAKPAGTWEAVRWWLYPEAIPKTMRWSVGLKIPQSGNRRIRAQHLQSLGFG